MVESALLSAGEGRGTEAVIGSYIRSYFLVIIIVVVAVISRIVTFLLQLLAKMEFYMHGGEHKYGREHL